MNLNLAASNSPFGCAANNLINPLQLLINVSGDMT
jgi:hypothetical protein